MALPVLSLFATGIEMAESKRLLWEIMIALDEAGEEDICALLNEVMKAQEYYGSGADLDEYLNALQRLEQMGELLIREYRFVGNRMAYGRTADAGVSDALFRFDPREGFWTWKGESRLMVQVTNGP